MLRSGVGALGVKREVLAEVAGKLDALQPRTLVVYGMEDSFIPNKYAKRACNTIRKSRCIGVPNAGHCLPLERQEDFIRIVKPFLSASSKGG